eukprot:s6155_g2.t1
MTQGEWDDVRELLRKVDKAGKLNELMTVHRKERKNAPMNREWPPDVNSAESDDQNSQFSGAAASAAGHGDIPPSFNAGSAGPVPPDPFRPPPGAFYPEEFERQKAEYMARQEAEFMAKAKAAPATGPWKAAPCEPPMVKTANYDPRDDPWITDGNGPLDTNPNAIRYGQRPVLEIYGRVQQQSREAAEAAARAAQLAADRAAAAARPNSEGFPKARGSSSASAAEQHPPKARVDRAELLEEWEEFSVVSETEDSPPWFPNYPAGLPPTFKWGPSWEESDVEVDFSKVDCAIPKPAWIHSTEHWSRTIITMPKYRDQRLTFLEFTKLVWRRDQDAAKYAKKLIGKYRKAITANPRSQAPDLAAWCLHVRMDAFIDAGKSYRREFAEEPDP